MTPRAGPEPPGIHPGRLLRFANPLASEGSGYRAAREVYPPAAEVHADDVRT